MNIQRLLAGTLALVLIAGFTSPAFAVSSFTGAEVETPFDIESLPPIVLPATDEANVIFDNGRADASLFPCGMTAGLVYCADDFVLDADEILTDVHFDGFDSLGSGIPEFRYFILADDNGLPGAIIQSGDAVNEHKELIVNNIFRYWFDLDIPLPLNAGTTFWIAIDRVSDAGDVEWVVGENPVVGNQAVFTSDDGATWQTSLFLDFNFVLTGQPTVVGGELLINTTALLVAGAQTNAVWIMSALAVIGSVAFGALYLKTRRN